MTDDIRYWLQGESVQNFGDFLSEYFLRHLFFPQPSVGRDLRIVGSCIDDGFIDPAPLSASGGPLDGSGPIFWGCGLRKEDGLSEDRLGSAEFLAVRGPLTRSALRLGNSIPIGDPGLLLPAIHRATSLWRRTGATLLIPHFHEKRQDAELLELTGCSAVLRPNIPNDQTAISEIIDQIVAADFVLCGAMHAAIVAAAYGKPFAFWESGNVDLPFKWQDFAASLSMPSVFAQTLQEGLTVYREQLAPVLKIPVLWPLLVAAPLPVRPDAFICVLELDLQRHGQEAFNAGVSSRAANQLRDRLRDVANTVGASVALNAAYEASVASEAVLRDRVATLLACEERLSADLARLQADAEAMQLVHAQLTHQGELHLEETRSVQSQLQFEAKEQARLRAETARLTGEVTKLRAREAWLASEEARLHEAVQARNQALVHAQAEVSNRTAQLDRIMGSTLWRGTAPLRMLGERMPWLARLTRQLARLAWWTATLQLPRRLERRRRFFLQADLLRKSPLFDDSYYLERHPEIAGADPATHYVSVGAELGYEGCWLFDSRWYRSTYPDCAQSGLSPLAHYLMEGAAAGHDPHPLFDSAWYAGRNPDAGSGADLLLHFLRQGLASGAAPNPLFHSAGYLCEYRDARTSGLSAFEHFVSVGSAKGYQPHPFFDTAWYTAAYPEVAASGLDPLSYYLRHGAAMGHDCTPMQRHLPGFTLETSLSFVDRPDPEASIVIPAYGHYFDTLRCLHSIAGHSGGSVGYEIIVLDDDPSNPIATLLEGVSGLRVISNAVNLGFLRSCNQAKTLARGWHIVFLNNDTLVEPDWLEPLLQPVRRDPAIGMVGCKLLNADRTLQEAGGTIFRNGWGHSFGRGDDPDRPEYNYFREVDVVIGAAFLVRRDLFQALGGFDDRYAPAFYEEFDLAFEVRKAGLKVVYQPLSRVVHLGSTSYGAEMRDHQSLRNHTKFCAKWARELLQQPLDNGDMFTARQRSVSVGTILMIDDKVPEYDRHAGALTIFQYIKLLVVMGFRIIYCPADLNSRQPYTNVLQGIGVEIIYAPANLASWLAANGPHLTAVWTARPDVTAPLLDLIRNSTTAKILYYPHDLHFLREKRRYQLEGDLWALEESNRLRKLEVRIFRSVDCVLTPSADEAKVITSEAPDANVRVIPAYLYSTHSLATISAEQFVARRDVVFIGGFKHPPNVDAALWLSREIMPLIWQAAPDVRLIIVGDDPTEEVRALAADDRVEVTGYVPELRPYFERARLSISPLRYGAGVKGKIVSSLEAGVPVVTTKVGNEGIALRDGVEVLLGETPEALAEAALRLLSDASLCAALSTGGVTVIRGRFSEDLARETMQSVLGTVHCRVCGHVVVGVQHAPEMVCASCGAVEADQKFASALLAPIHGAKSLRQSLPALSRLRIHAVSGEGPLLEALRDSWRFTEGAIDGGSLPAQDGEIERLIDLHGCLVAEKDLREAYRVLSADGRYFSPHSSPRTGLLTAVGFEVASDNVVIAARRS